jgi:predicted HicB family RNase H-like nuclease
MSEDTSRYRVGPDTTFEEVDLDKVEVRLPDGRRLTERLAEELAEDKIRRRGGRPSLSGRAAESPQLGVRLSPDLHRRVRERAAAEGKKPSQIVREALEQYL